MYSIQWESGEKKSKKSAKQWKNSDNITHTTNNTKIEEERNEIETKEAESAISPTKKGVKRKIEKQQIIKDSSIRPAAQKTRKLNPPPNLISRNKKEIRQENLKEKESDSQEECHEKNENMKQKRSPQPMAIPIKNRFEALQAQDPCAPQSQETIIETLKKKTTY